MHVRHPLVAIVAAMDYEARVYDSLGGIPRELAKGLGFLGSA